VLPEIVREICDRHGVLFIADEVMMGAVLARSRLPTRRLKSVSRL
jgi:glutamate-1-semialdehyde aminotransferase